MERDALAKLERVDQAVAGNRPRGGQCRFDLRGAFFILEQAVEEIYRDLYAFAVVDIGRIQAERVLAARKDERYRRAGPDGVAWSRAVPAAVQGRKERAECRDKRRVQVRK